MSEQAPIHGNYHGYYLKRPPSLSEPRLQALPRGLLADAVVLDIGCNEGWITCEIAQNWNARKVVGVDIDDTLVQNAWKRRRTLWSLQEPLRVGDGELEYADEEKLRLRKKKGKRKRTPSPPRIHPTKNYFPASCEHEFGPLPIPPYQVLAALGSSSVDVGDADYDEDEGGKPKTSTSEATRVFPYNVLFRTADWTKADIVEDAQGYGVVFALSLTKWIHLNNGDAGLRTFFEKVHRVLKRGGTLVLEPQPWESYAKARRMSEALKQSYQSLVLRPSDFSGILREIGFGEPRRVVGQGPEEEANTKAGSNVGFDRPIDLYVKL
ncbi:Bin3-domain-containing protein [Coprinopsis marcescibilis]|uniref:RNA methyltransferase n=1 Tax=Coprinopsis marcescibilis TaxID=230819 RepID=A0A5C3KHW2_COPMA|nr:Bin3-domain-containing protein [Coprinopsis marcescibilis]